MSKKQAGFGLMAIVLALAVCGVLGFAGWYVLGRQDAETSATDSATNPSEQPSPTTTANFSDGPAAGWKTYTNKEHGFSIAVPKTFVSDYGAPCKKEATSYRPNRGEVRTAVVQDGGSFAITEDVTYQLTGQHPGEGGVTDYSGCERTVTTVDTVRKYDAGGNSDEAYPMLAVLPVAIATARNDEEVTAKARAMTTVADARIAELKPNAGGWQDVILTCGSDKDQYCAAFTYRYQLRYYQAQSKLVYISQGHTGKLQKPGPGDAYATYDDEVVASFKLLR